MPNLTQLASGAALLCAATASLAQSAGPSFTVPLELKNIHPAVVRGRVLCAINPPNATLASDTLAVGNTEFAIVGQVYRGDVVVRTAYAAGKTGANAAGSPCGLWAQTHPPPPK